MQVIKCLFPQIRAVTVNDLETGLVVDGSDLWVANGTIDSLVTSNVKYGVTLQANAGKQVNQMLFLGGYIGGQNIANGKGVQIGTGNGYLGGANKFFGTHVEGINGTGGIGWHLRESGDPGDQFYGIGYEACTVGGQIESASVSNFFAGTAELAFTDNGINTMMIGANNNARTDSLRFVGWSSTITPDLTQGTVKEVSPMTGPTTIANPVQTGQQGQHLIFMLQQDGTGSRVVTWGSKYKVAPACRLSDGEPRSTVHFVYNAYDAIWCQVGGAAGTTSLRERDAT